MPRSAFPPKSGAESGSKPGRIFLESGAQKPQKTEFHPNYPNPPEFFFVTNLQKSQAAKEKILGVLGNIRRIWSNFKFSTSFRVFCPLFAPWFLGCGVPSFSPLIGAVLWCSRIRLGRTNQNRNAGFWASFRPAEGGFSSRSAARNLKNLLVEGFRQCRRPPTLARSASPAGAMAVGLGVRGGRRIRN